MKFNAYYWFWIYSLITFKGAPPVETTKYPEDHRDSNAAFNISANGWFLYEQTVGQSASTVRSIGGPLNQSYEKAVQLESSGGSR